ncbi:ankyrin repeat domain-containing protein [Streptomyces marincola]|uniref:ankyrin repeat domain-containing protein n=1 Tax=Streptomyces marincola TaxID=2878388 RepID=UPI001CF41EAA|nr:ankyrin repeat domain-containing protein [Streptomyces marincola]UCM88173.1 ankyrin repeat domain-containing protein [Streptomyces marincola]
MVDAARTREIVGKLFADVASGNVEGVLAALAPNIVFDLPRTAHNLAVPNTGRWLGKEGVIEAFRLRSERSEVTEFEQRDMVVEGNRAFVINYQKIHHRVTGFEVEFEFSMILTVGDDELVHHWKAFFDASGEVAMFRSDVDARLLAAVSAGDRREVTAMLREGGHPDHRDPATGLTILQTAAGRGDAETLRLLIAAGGDVYGTDSRAGTTALHKAVQRGDLETVRVLVEAGAFVDAVAPTTGHTPLMDALWFKWPEIVGYLLDQGAGLGLHTHYGFSLQEHFDYELNVNVLGKDRLLRAEELLKERRREDERLIAEQRVMAAVVSGDTARVRSLIASGADLEARFPVVNGFNDRHTPLLVASRDGHTQIVQALVAAGADVNATEPTFGASPLHKAVYNGHADITRLLVDAPGIDLDYQGATNGYTALHDALWHGYEDCARVLLSAGARTDLRGHDDKTALDIARETFGDAHALVRQIAGQSA